MGGTSKGDPLARWLEGEGFEAIDTLLLEAPDIFAIIDRDLKIRFINWTGPAYTREKAIGQDVLSLLRPEHRDAAREAYGRALREGVRTQFEVLFSDAQSVRLWDVRVGPIRVDGEVVGLIATTSDVTEQRRAQADRDRFFSLSLDMLVVTTPAGSFKRLNPAFGEILGYDVTYLMGTLFMDLVHPDDVASTQKVFERVLGGEHILDFENRYRRRDETYRVFSWRAAVDPVTGDVYAVARDVTDHRSTEAQLRHAQKMEAVGQLAGGVAHDFNNLLLAVLANSELAKLQVPRGSDVAEHLTEIERAADRAAALTKQLLAFSRRQPLHPVPVDLNRLIQGTMQMLRRILPESIFVDWVPGHNIASVSADPSQLEQVIVNLCVNARDAMDQGGQLTLETENILINGRYREAHPWARPGRYVLLTVTDTGTGMTPEVRERVFEPFFTTKEPQRGTGLGLSTVYGIVRQHNGMIHLYSEPGLGTTFKIYLPADSRLAVDVGHKLEARTPRGKETILLAEDEELVRRAVVLILERAGYRAIAVENGVEAVRTVRERTGPIDLVLLDVVMPELGGPDAWERIHALNDELRVIFVTGYADNRYRDSLPADAEVLYKPFRPEELLRCVRKVLDRGSAREASE